MLLSMFVATATISSAQITYSNQFQIPENESRSTWDVEWTITTNGALGNIAPGDIISWSISLNGDEGLNAGFSELATAPSSYIKILGTAPFATDTELFLPDGGYIQLLTESLVTGATAPPRLRFRNIDDIWEIYAAGIQPPGYAPLGNSISHEISITSDADIPFAITSDRAWNIATNTAVPEPSTYAIILGGICFALAFQNRRRSR